MNTTVENKRVKIKEKKKKKNLHTRRFLSHDFYAKVMSVCTICVK